MIMQGAMPRVASRVKLPSAIARSVRQREIRRQLLYNRVRRVAASNSLRRFLADRIPALPAEFLKLFAGSLLGYWIVASLLAHFFRFNPVNILSAFGLLYSIQSVYYKYQLSKDPSYRIPRCRCAGRRNDNAEVVLLSRQSAIFGIPNGVLGVVLYLVLPLLVHRQLTNAAISMAAIAALGSLYLGYVMVFRIRNLCTNCINVLALNGLIVWWLIH